MRLQDVHRDALTNTSEPGSDRIWIFRATGRAARVVRVISKHDVDVVVFRFCGIPNERRTTAKRFLADFVRPS